MKVAVLGTGRALPAHSRDSFQIDLDLKTGNRVSSSRVNRRFVCREETQIDLARTASLEALESAKQKPSDLDLIISGASVPYQPIPATAPLIMRSLGIPDGVAAAFDVNSTCLSFISALEIAGLMINNGTVRRALVVSSEIASRALPWEKQPEVAALFGDGAGAFVLGPAHTASPSAIKAVRLRSYPSVFEACGIGSGGTKYDFDTEHDAFVANSKFTMDGKVLFRLTAQKFNQFVNDLLEQAGWKQSDVDLVVPHQASPAALDHLIRLTGFDRTQVVSIVEDYGNQIAASIPFTFDIAGERNLLTLGRKVLLLGTSAGVSFGGAALVI
tara:strand:+ start:106 stop:1092 length:987 start_codon:yes stop_codon:yes gene_type:complete